MAVLDEAKRTELAPWRRVRHSGATTSHRDANRAMPADSLDARECLKAIAERRDRAAFGALVDHFAPRLRAFLRRSGAGEAEIDDVVQEAMLKVWRRAEQFDAGRGSPSTWIFTIARNERINLLRREIRPELDPNDPALVPAPETPADESVANVQDADRLHAALRTLPAEQAEVLNLAFFEELSHSTIAERLDLPLGTIKSRIRLAVGRLRDALESAQ
ncbi:MAG: sigma-70 family RNA polymerase sigma factor [Alphaproteobacteria bacterium]